MNYEAEIKNSTMYDKNDFMNKLKEKIDIFKKARFRGVPVTVNSRDYSDITETIGYVTEITDTGNVIVEIMDTSIGRRFSEKYLDKGFTPKLTINGFCVNGKVTNFIDFTIPECCTLVRRVTRRI